MKLSLRRTGGTLPGLRGRLSGSGGFASVGVVAVLLGSMLATVFGAGAASRVLNIADGNVWLWSSEKGEAGRVNTASGKVDQRAPLTDAHGHRVQITQTDKHVLIRDLDTGKISSLDLNQLGGARAAQGPQGPNVRVVLAGDAAFLVDNVAGQLQQIDPTTLTKIGGPLSFPPTLAGGVADQTGRVWFAVPSQGTVTAVSATASGSDAPAAEAANTTTKGAQIAANAKVGEPDHTYAMTALKSGAAIIDTTDGRISTVNGNKVGSVVPSPIRGPVLVPDHTDGVIPITQPSTRSVFLVNGPTVNKVTVPGSGQNLGTAVVFGGQMYVADNTSHTVQVMSLAGAPVTPIAIPDANGPIELEVREDHLVINAPSSSHAVVVDGQGGRLNVDKYPPDVPGPVDQGEAQAPPTNPNTNPVGGGAAGGAPTAGNGNGQNNGNNGNSGPNAPALTAPGSVPSLQASAGNKSVQLSWRRPTSGGAVNSYVISAPGRSSVVVPGGRRSATIDGLTNGVEYRFSVTARNRVGSGPESIANPVTPTGDVPGIPTNVSATPQKDGSVTVNWTEPIDKGPGIIGYTVTATGPGSSQEFENDGGKSISIPAGSLQYGQNYAFTVTAKGLAVAGQPSQPSNAVSPFTKPAAPAVEKGDVTTGSVTFTWSKPEANGRPVTGYDVVASPGKSEHIGAGQTSYTVSGLQPNTNVNFTLTATNEAGTSDPGTQSAKTSDPAPKIQNVDESASNSYTQAKVTFKINWGAGAKAGKCKITIDGKSAGTSCATGSVTVDRASKGYAYKITATSATGTQTDEATGDANSALFTIHNSCDNSAAGDNCGLGILDKVPTSDPDQGPKSKGELAKGDSASAQCYGLGYQSQTGNQVNEHASENGGKGRQSKYWIYIPNAGGGYVVGAYLEESDGTLNNLPKC